MVDTRDLARELAVHFGVSARVTRHHNHAGPGKLLFRATTAAVDMWVKVAASAREDYALRRWADVSNKLVARYAAPPVLETLEIHGRFGLVFPFLRAPVATRHVVRSRVTQILKVLDDLHGDEALASQLGPSIMARTAVEELWLRRLTADLDIIQGHVSETEFLMMAGWVGDLTERISHPAFDVTVHAPIHADPWHENFLVDGDCLWLLDWEDLRIGDPVIDAAIVLYDAFGPVIEKWLAVYRPEDDAAGHRLSVAMQALVVDQAVDGAADFVQNTDPHIKAAKQLSYQEASRWVRRASRG